MNPLTAFCLVVSLLCRPGTAPVYVGRENQLHVRIPHVPADAATVTIDGRLDEPVWQQAALLTGFSQFAPVDGIPAADSTQVLVWSSPTALYIGIRAFEQHGAVHATLADRDKISADDNVQILLGTYHDQRQAYVFAVNPLGVQMDGTIVETGQNITGGWTPTLSGRVAPDLSQDFVFSSKGRLTDFGFEVEMRIPFKSLSYQSADEQSWDINIIRQVQHSGFEDSWAPARRGTASFLGQGGSLEDLRSLDRGLVLDVNPFATQKVAGTPGSRGWAYGSPNSQLGANVRWGVTNNLTLNGTVRPDFAEVESDAGQLVIDPRRALFFPEKRPFFLEGLDQFSVPNNLIYTRRIAQPELAATLAGKVAGTSIGLLSSSDDPVLSPSGHNATISNIFRAQRDIGGQSRIGVAYTDRVTGADYNRVADMDGRVVFGKVYSGSFQFAESYDRTAGVSTSAPLWEAIAARNGKRFGFRYTVTGISEDFRPGSGFISRAGVAHAAADHRVTWFGDRGNAVESFTGDVMLDNTWQYSHFVRQGDAQDKKFHLGASAGLRGGWTLGAGIYWETFGFDTKLYGNYAIERTVGTHVDTVPFTGIPRIANRDYVASLSTPQWTWFNATVLYVFGQDENFFEWAQANINYVSLSLNARPSERLRLAGTLNYQDFLRRSDGSLAGSSAIGRLKVEYQLTRSIFLRTVGEYDRYVQDDLRDETRTFFPLIIGGKKALASRRAVVHGDYLFSYRPTPGTVAFLGYGSEADATPNPVERFNLQAFRRMSDYFFVKVSYLFRT